MAAAWNAAPDRQAESKHYYATQIGAKWTYAFPEKDIAFAVTKVAERDGAKIVSVGQIGDGGTVKRNDVIEVSDKGLLQIEQVVHQLQWDGNKSIPLNDGWKEYDPPLRLLKLPAKPGDTWSCQLSPEAKKTFAVRAPERVKVPAGEYTAIPVEVALVANGKTVMEWKYWYAAGVGAVKWTYPEDGGKTGEIVLKAFTAGGD